MSGYGASHSGGVRGMMGGVIRLFEAIPYALVALVLRLTIAHPFFVSGQTKVEGPSVGRDFGWLDLTFTVPTRLREATFTLFADDYKVPLLPTELAAYLATFAEHILPILIVVGLATRFASFGLLVMACVIQIFVYPDAWWTVHAYWVAILLVLITKGPGAISLDRFWRKA